MSVSHWRAIVRVLVSPVNPEVDLRLEMFSDGW